MTFYYIKTFEMSVWKNKHFDYFKKYELEKIVTNVLSKRAINLTSKSYFNFWGVWFQIKWSVKTSICKVEGISWITKPFD